MANNIIISLSNKELLELKIIAENRQKVHDDVNRFDAKVLLNKGNDVHFQGVVGEFVVSKALNLKWDGKFKNNEDWKKWRINGSDVSGLEVRFTKHKNGRLILHKKDKDNTPYILVCEIKDTTYEIVGWILGKEGKKQEYWEDVGYGRPCYYVPRIKLNNINTLGI